MKTLFFLSVLSSFLGMTSTSLSGNQGRGTNDSIQDRFVGAWRLASLETQDADGKTHRADSTGLLVFTRDGHMSVQVMERNPPAHTTAASEQYSQGGYEASFGSYQINESTHTFTYHVEGALVRSLIGKGLPRAFELYGNQLIVKSTHPDEHWKANEHWKAIWEHY